jgi:hypothetical protein
MRGPEEYTKTVRIGHSLKWMAGNYMAPRGINLKVVTVPDLNNETDETICKFIANALNPTYPKYKQDIDSEISKLRVCQDNIKTWGDWKKVNNQKENFTETIIDSSQDLLEDTPLDHQIKRATQIQQVNGKRLIRIWGKPN